MSIAKLTYNCDRINETMLCYLSVCILFLGVSYRFSLRIRDKPWQWTENDDGISTLEDPSHDNYKRHLLAAMAAVSNFITHLLTLPIYIYV